MFSFCSKIHLYLLAFLLKDKQGIIKGIMGRLED